MDPSYLIQNHSILYHMAEDGSWPSIREHGLLSTSALLDLYEVAEREELESRKRPEIAEITHPEYGSALIRDNKPIQDRSLEKCLSGMSVAELVREPEPPGLFLGLVAAAGEAARREGLPGPGAPDPGGGYRRVDRILRG